MDSLDILARENEFKKLNKQLEMKTESLMKEIEQLMHKQDISSNVSQNLRITPSPRISKSHSCNSTKSSTQNSADSHKNVKHRSKFVSNKTFKVDNINTADDKEQNHYSDSLTKSNNDNESLQQGICYNCMHHENHKMTDDLEFLYAFVSINVKDNILPQSFLKENLTVQRVCKFLSAKVKLMQEQLNKMQSVMEKKRQQCEGHLSQFAELESERLTLRNKVNTTRADAADARAKCLTLQNKLDEKDRLYKEQRSATDRLTTEAKQVRSKNAALEARCAAQEEAIATLKQQLETARMAEKELRDSSRNLSASHQSSISRLQTRCRHLTSCIEKQNSLIVNLKKQNMLLTAGGAFKALEKEYNEFLNQDF